MGMRTDVSGIAPCVNAEQFEAMKARFRDVGDCLTDEQLLELADCYHEILRWRRDVRLRHADLTATRACSEPRSFLASQDIDPIRDDHLKMSNPQPVAPST